MIALRPYRAEDLAGLVAIVPGATAASIAEHLDYPGYDPTRDLLVATDDGDVVAARDVRVMARGDEPRLILESWGPTSPAAWSTDAPRALVAAMLDRARALLAARERAEATLQVRAAPDDAFARDLFGAFGFATARRLWSMVRRDLANLPAPTLPEGIVVREYVPGADDARWLAAFNEAFADHWGGWMQLSDAFWRRYVARPTFRPELSLVAWDGGEIAGFCHCRLDDGATGQIRYVGVRPGWRRRGLGEALTRLGLVTLREAGADQVGLGVDATNSTGAQELYQRLGFVVTREQVMYRKEVTR